ncbi:hypothetical protein [Vibrio sp. B181a]|uniref:hypothetical protein n=1 Tax=Vibrio sp. B181a TaxID=2835906 RepID=UPI00255563A5|nr:hypothetical protein [Vibrio sp. B181a]MDK9774199.1 hypothetical protein [Vibrio sp. B181a]
MLGLKLWLVCVEQLNSVFPHVLFDDIDLWLKRRRLTALQQAEFVEFYSELKLSGTMDKEALEALRDEYESSYGKDCMQYEFCVVALNGMGAGDGGLDKAMTDWFYPELAMIVKTANHARKNRKGNYGDEMEHSESPLQLLLNHENERQRIAKKLRGIFKKPVLLVTLSLLSTYVAAMYGVSAFAGDTPKSEWSAIALAYDSFGHWLAEWTRPIIACVFGVMAAYLYGCRWYDGEYRLELDKCIPGYSYYQAKVAGQFFSIMSVLVSPNGGAMKLKEALNEFQSNEALMTPYIGIHVDEMISRSGSGEFNLEQLDTGLLPKRVKMRLRVAGRSQKGLTTHLAFQTISENLARDYGDAIVKRVDKSMAVVWIVSLLLMIGAFVACLDGAFAKLDQMV